MYGHPKVDRRRSVWELVSRLKPYGNAPLFCIWNFNDIVHASEAKGIRPSMIVSTSALASFCDSYEMVDLGFVGPKFIWSNKQIRQLHLMKRLDRVIASIEVMMRFLNAIVEHYPLIGSDHWPILLFMGGKGYHCRKHFRFKDKWIKMEGFQYVIVDSWRECGLEDKQLEFQSRLSNVKRGLI